MTMENKYIFTSERLGFRNWTSSDLDNMAEINAIAKVMEYFPSTQTLEQTKVFIERMQESFERTGFCYFAVEKLEDGKLIGFIGLNEQKFEADFTPCIDIGWRLHPNAWKKGYATEGAKACLYYAFEVLKLNKIYAFTPVINLKSEQVMKRIGMKKVKHFNFPLFANDERLKECVLYEITQ